MNRLIAFLVTTFGLLRPSVYAPIYCDGCAMRRGHITRAELAVLLVHSRLLCSCGGQWTYIGPDREDVAL
ncbi:MAG: hypothetical protein ACRDPR_12550 [Nocardioidaceae bacterium]